MTLKNNLLTQYSVGKIEINSPFTQHFFNLAETYFVFWVEKGNLSLTIEGVKNIIPENYFVFCNTKTIISLQSENNSTIRYFQFLSPKYTNNYSVPFIDSYSLFFNENEFYKKVFLIDEYKTIIRFYYKYFLSLQQNIKDPLNLLSVNTTIQHVIFLAISLFEDRAFLLGKSQESHRLSKFKELVEENIFKERSVIFYCNAIGLEYSSLNKLCISEFGTNVKNYLDIRCVTHIKCKLSTSSLTISEISDFFHFTDTSNFNRFFKRLTMMTPTEFRDSVAIIN